MSKNLRACALAVPGVRARRARTAEDGKSCEKKNFPKCRKIFAHAHWRCRVYVRAGPGPRKMEKLRKKKISRNVEKSSRMRTGGAGGTCAQDPDRGRWKSCEKKKFPEMSKNLRACALAVPGVRARRARTAEDGKVAKKKKFHEMSKNSRACALTVPGVRARRARTAEDGKVAKKKISRNVEKYSRMRTGGAGGTCAQGTDRGRWKSCEKKKFHEMSKNSRACALVVPGGRARRDPDRGRWKSCEKKNFSKCRKILAHAHWRCRGYVRVGHGPRKMEKLRKKKISRNVEKFSRMRTGGAGGTCAQDPDRGRWNSCEKKKFHEMSKNSRACALAVPGGRPRRTRTAEDGKVAKKKNFTKCRKILAHAHWRCRGTCAQDPDRGRWNSCEKKNFPKCRKIFAHAHWRCRVYVRAGPGPRKME